MKKLLLLVSLLLTGFVALRCTAADAGAASLYSPLASFVGGTWVAKFPPQKDAATMRIEMQFAWNSNRQGVHFDATWFTNDKPAPYTSGCYAWNPVKKSFVIFYTDSHASLTEGTVAATGDVLEHEMTVSNQDGSIDHVRVRLTKRGDDVFDDEIFILKDNAWSKFVEVRYERRK